MAGQRTKTKLLGYFKHQKIQRKLLNQILYICLEFE